MTLNEDIILKQCDRLEEQIRRVCFLLSIKLPDAPSGDVTRHKVRIPTNNVHPKTLDVNQIYQVIELSSYSNNKSVLFEIVKDSFLKMENARIFAKTAQVEKALQELCNGFMMIGLGFSKLYSSDASMTASEAAVKSNDKVREKKGELIDITVDFLEKWGDFSEKISVERVTKAIAKSMVKRNEYIQILNKTWPEKGILKDASNLSKIEEPLQKRLTGYFSRNKKLKDLMRQLKEKSRQNKR